MIAGALGALVVCSFFFFYYKTPAAQNAETPKPSMKQEEPTPPKQIQPPPPSEDVNESDVEALTIETVYKNFYAEGSKCRQTYNEYFKNTDGVGSSSSPCSVKLTFNRDGGSAEKTIEVRRYDTTAKEWRVVEENVWKSKVSDAEFKELAKIIVNNDAFKAWNDMTLINVSNCKITVRHSSGTKSPMSNVDEKATAYLPMVEAFKKLDGKTAWEKVQ